MSLPLGYVGMSARSRALILLTWASAEADEKRQLG